MNLMAGLVDPKFWKESESGKPETDCTSFSVALSPILPRALTKFPTGFLEVRGQESIATMIRWVARVVTILTLIFLLCGHEDVPVGALHGDGLQHAAVLALLPPHDPHHPARHLLLLGLHGLA